MSIPAGRPREDEWLRILRVDDHSWLGRRGGILEIGDERGPKRVLDAWEPIPLLPLLERPYQDVLAEVREYDRASSVPAESLRRQIPWARIPHAAASTKMDYWIQLALDWLSEMDTAEVDLQLVQHLASSTWATQRARHRARALVKRIAGLPRGG